MNKLFSILIVLIVCSPPCMADESRNIQMVVAMTEAINSRDLNALDAFVSADVVRHSAATPGVVVTNIDEFRTFLEADFATVPDSVQIIDIIFGSGDYVAVRARYMGTQTGPMGPFPASGKKLELPYMGIVRIEGGKIKELWVEWDNLNVLAQLGHYPPADD